MFRPSKKSLILSAAVAGALLCAAALSPVASPFFSSLSKIPFVVITAVRHEIGGVLFFHRNLYQNDALRRENELLRRRLGEVSETFFENERLRKLLEFKQQSSFNVLPARVVAVTADTWSSGVVIDRGSSRGFRRGQVVITPAGLVGRIVEVQSGLSKVMLINDPALAVSAYVQRNRLEGLVTGSLGATLLMKYLPRDADISVGDTILSSGLTEMYPKGIAIGTVVEIGQENAGLNRFAVIKPAANLSNLEEVLVIVE